MATLSTRKINKLINDSNKFLKFAASENNGNISKLLNRLGRLSKDFDEKPLLYLLDNGNDKVRSLVIKNLAKLRKILLLGTFTKVLNNDTSTDVRREAVSAIGRLRNVMTIPILESLLEDKDPEVVLQAIRGLLVFKNKGEIRKDLLKLKSHPNEIIQEVIKKEFSNNVDVSRRKDHTKSPNFLKNTVVNGDVLQILKFVPNESVHLTFTSPPYYNARDYSIYESYDDYLKFLKKVFAEVHRVTKEGRFFVLNTSPIIIPRVSRQHSSKRYPIPFDIHPILIKMGWDFIDDIYWVKPEESVKNRNAGFLQHRKPLGYKTNARTECVMVYRKKTDKLIDWNMKQYDPKVIERSKVKGKYETSNVWKIDPVFDKTHSAVFPIELCNRVIKFYSYIGDLVFDPFGGSGTFGKSALTLNRHFFLTEKDLKYFRRIKENIGGETIFSNDYNIPKYFDLVSFIKFAKNQK